MSRPTDVESQREDQSTADQEHIAGDHGFGSGPCPRCQALEARIAELEAAVQSGADRGDGRDVPAWPSVAPPGIQGPSAAPLGLGRGMAVTPFAAAAALDGRVATRLQVLAAGHGQPVGLADPLPDRRRRHLGRKPESLGLAQSRSLRSISRRSRASSARGSSRSRPPGSFAPRPAGTCISRGRAIAGNPTASRWKA